MLSRFSRPALLALTTLGATLGLTTLGTSSAIANPTTPPLDIKAFADRIVSYDPGTSDGYAAFGDPNAPGRLDVYDAESALGRNDWTKDMTRRHGNEWGRDIGVSLGRKGALTVEFTDNFLVGNGNETADLWVYEIGGVAENAAVQISIDNDVWYDLGNFVRQSSEHDTGVGFDIDGLLAETAELTKQSRFSFVKVIDVDTRNEQGKINDYSNNKAGADIDAIAALSFVVKADVDSVDVPEPGLMLGFGLMGAGFLFRRKSDKAAS